MLSQIPEEIFLSIIKECGRDSKRLIPCCKLYSTMDILVDPRNKKVNMIVEKFGTQYYASSIHITHLIASKVVTKILLDDMVINLDTVNSYKIEDTQYVCYDISSCHGMCKDVVVNDIKYGMMNIKKEENQEIISKLPFEVKLLGSAIDVMFCIDKIVCFDYNKLFQKFRSPPESSNNSGIHTSRWRSGNTWFE